MPTLRYLLLLLFGIACAPLQAQNLSISGVVTDGQTALPGVVVYLHETHQSAQTDIDGRFTLLAVKPGIYHIHFQLLGFNSYSETVRVTSGTNVTMLIAMKEAKIQLDEVWIEADRNHRSQQSQSVATITERFIEQKNGNTLMETLEPLPGISSLSTGTGVSKPVIRGLSMARVTVADQGIKQEGQQWGADHGLEIDQYNVEHAQIIKGPGSLMYGSDALGGIVSISQPTVVANGIHKADLRSIFKSVNNTKGLTLGFKGNHNGWSYRLRCTRLRYEDYKVPEDTFYYQDTYFPLFGNRLKNTAGEETHAAMMLGKAGQWGYSYTTLSSYDQRVGLFTGAIGRVTTDRLLPDGSNNIDLSFQRVQHYKLINNSSFMLKHGWIESDIGIQFNRRREFSFPHIHGQPGLPTNTLALELMLGTLSANTRYQVRHAGGLLTSVGLQQQHQSNTVGGFEFLIPGFQQHQFGLYLLETWEASEQWQWNVGIRAEHAHTIARQTILPFYRRLEYIGDIERNGAINKIYLNYAAGAGVVWKPTTISSFKLNLGRAFRIPTVAELTAFGMHHASFRFEQGDPGLNPEIGWQADAEAQFKTGRWQLTVSPFYYYFQNYIYQRPTGFFPQIELNGGIFPLPATSQRFQYTQTTARLYGTEAEASVFPLNGLKWYVNIEMVHATNLAEGLPLPFTPPMATFTGLQWVIPSIKGILRQVYFDVEVGTYDAQFRVDRNEFTTPGATVVHSSVGGVIGSKKREWFSIAIQVRNATNALYYNHLSRYRILNLPEPARNIVCTVSFKLEKSPQR